LEKVATLAAAVLDTTLEEAHVEVLAIWRLTVTELNPDMEDHRTRLALEKFGPGAALPCLNTMKCAGEKHYLSDCPHIGKDEAVVLLSEYEKKANSKTLGNKEATADKRDGQIAYLTAENLGVKFTVLADTGSYFFAIPRSAVEDARKRGFPLKVEALPEPIMLNMAIRGERDKNKCSAKEMLMSAVTITTLSGPL
jgi:hypothetical protein